MHSRKWIRHIVFWILFLLLWSVHDLNYHADILENIETNVFAFIPYAMIVYVNLYFLMPRFLLQKRIISYVLLLLISIIVTTVFSSYYLAYYFEYINVYLPTARFFASLPGKIAIVTEVILSLCLSMTLFLIDAWYQKERSIQEIAQKQLETELNLLKNQINPHFLFNSLNSIYVMLGKNLEQGKNLLLQFSEILSHQLYETSKQKIPLEREFENLQNYIDIERIRHEDLAQVVCTFPENIGTLEIAPMLLLPLVENAFKHGQSAQGYHVKIEASMDHGTLKFNVENSIPEKDRQTSEKSNGIGLTNVRRRLALLYPNQHLFQVVAKNATFIVNLTIQLDED